MSATTESQTVSAPETAAKPEKVVVQPSPATTAVERAAAPAPTAAQPEIRCYWALLSADLTFIYLDPVFAAHLEAQAENLIGKALLQFVHPDEQQSAKADLANVMESRTLHGSVTRVRFHRLSSIRRMLSDQAATTPTDDAFKAVDIVINFASEGLILCFIHAVDWPSDTSADSNWCGTPEMTVEQTQLLFRRLLASVRQTGSMERMFQILSNQTERHLMLSWPPDQGSGPMGRDFARLVEKVQMGSGAAQAPADNEAGTRTSCTRRFRSLQTMPGIGTEVESIFIPHGSVIFACHKQTQAYFDPNSQYTAPPVSNIHPPGEAYNQWSRSAAYPPQGQPWPESQPPYVGNYPYGSNGVEDVPAPRRRVSPGTQREYNRSTGNRPVGVLKCTSCKATSSPEWRKGPSGKKELCNACGLRYARSKAKKEGHEQNRRRKEKSIAKRQSATPPVSAQGGYMQRGYDGPVYMAGAPPGSDVYGTRHDGGSASSVSAPPHAGQPQPQQQPMDFVHYATPQDGHSQYPAPPPPGNFYAAAVQSPNPAIHGQMPPQMHPASRSSPPVPAHSVSAAAPGPAGASVPAPPPQQQQQQPAVQHATSA
ncbi:hypothetical protein FISHEDRAFT_77882 [Fistulina hepatica ATCC 64428]|nr:hypothetical protein FISHEDRAFT_77882 [Fistulina hepatica ATCC 64428]